MENIDYKKESTIIEDISKVMLANKIRLVKDKIEELSDKHQYYMEISQGDGSRATEVIEARQSKLWKLLDKLQGNTN